MTYTYGYDPVSGGYIVGERTSAGTIARPVAYWLDEAEAKALAEALTKHAPKHKEPASPRPE